MLDLGSRRQRWLTNALNLRPEQSLPNSASHLYLAQATLQIPKKRRAAHSELQRHPRKLSGRSTEDRTASLDLDRSYLGQVQNWTGFPRGSHSAILASHRWPCQRSPLQSFTYRARADAVHNRIQSCDTARAPIQPTHHIAEHSPPKRRQENPANRLPVRLRHHWLKPSQRLPTNVLHLANIHTQITFVGNPTP